MNFSNPVDGARENGAGYVAALLAVLGDRDPVEVMRELVPQVESATRGLSDQVLRRPEREGKWSIIDVVQHLADTELVMGFRMRMALAHDGPKLAGFDQDLWAAGLRYNERGLDEAISELKSGRDANVRLSASLSPAELKRWGMHSERGEESVIRMLELAAGHGLVHVRQIERIRNAHGA